MTTVSLQVPQSGLPNSTEDPKIASDLTAIQNVINGNLDSTNLSAAAGITLAQLAVVVQQMVFSPGDLKPSAAPTAPTGWLLCQGQAVSRVTYAALFAVIGGTWGAGDGTTFNLPDLRGKTIVGAGTGSGLSARTLGQTGGEESHVLTAPELASHFHNFSVNLAASSTGWAGTFAGNGPVNGIYQTGTISNVTSTEGSGSNVPHQNMQPFAVLNWMIKT